MWVVLSTLFKNDIGWLKLYGRFCPRDVSFVVVCFLYGMFCPRDVLFVVCFLYGMFCPGDVLFVVCFLYGMLCPCVVLFMVGFFSNEWLFGSRLTDWVYRL